MKTAFACIAALCFVSVLACGEPESEIDNDIALVDPTTETVGAETTMDEEEADELGTELVMEEASATDVTHSEALPSRPDRSQPAEKAPAPVPPAEKTPAVSEAPARTEAKPTQPAPKTAPPEQETGRDPAPDRSKLPKTHTIDKDGTMHAPGLENPTSRCTACHGKDLRGGRAGISCFDCHDKQWD